MTYAGDGILHQHLENIEGVSFVLTSDEMSYLLDLLNQYRSIVSRGTDALVYESVEGPLDELIASFAYQRAL